MPDTRHPLDTTAVASMLVLCALWGFQQVAIKLAAHGVSPLMQGALRSAVALVCLVAWSRWRGIPLHARDGTLVPGLVAGLLFGTEFSMIYAGLAHTTASRMVVFLYVAPALTALGLALVVPGESLRPAQWTGIALAFAGIAFAFREGFDAAGRATWIGDALGLGAAVGWAATTVLIRATSLSGARAEKTLAWQLAVSAPLMLGASLALGEAGVVALTPLALASLAFQSVVVAFASYLTWFWLLTRYLGGRLAVFSFATPLFGVAFGHAVLGEPLTPAFLAAVAMVGAGIALVNLRR